MSNLPALLRREQAGEAPILNVKTAGAQEHPSTGTLDTSHTKLQRTTLFNRDLLARRPAGRVRDLKEISPSQYAIVCQALVIICAICGSLFHV
jgi:hypothetical protein